MDKVEAATREELERLRRDGFDKTELEDARRGALEERRMARSDDATLAAGWVANLDLNRTFAFSRKLEDQVRALTVTQLNEAVRRYLDPARLTVVVAGDAKKGAQ